MKTAGVGTESVSPAGVTAIAIPSSGAVAARLGLWDTVSIIVGIVVGTTIFRSPMLVFQNTAGPWHALGVWLLGGVLCVFGEFCYAELATTYPRNGGDYEYLSRAYGRWMGFLFGWAQLAVILTGSIGIMAYAFADYAKELWSLPPWAVAWVAAAAVAAITAAQFSRPGRGKILAERAQPPPRFWGSSALWSRGCFAEKAAHFSPGKRRPKWPVPASDSRWFLCSMPTEVGTTPPSSRPKSAISGGTCRAR